MTAQPTFFAHQKELITSAGDDTRQFFFLDHPKTSRVIWTETPIWLRPKPRLPACLSRAPDGRLILDPSKMLPAAH